MGTPVSVDSQGTAASVGYPDTVDLVQLLQEHRDIQASVDCQVTRGSAA